MAKISPGTMTAIIFAILIGLAGAYTVRHYLDQAPAPEEVAQRQAAARPVIVPVAAREIPVGHTLTINDIAIQSFTAEEFKKSPYATQGFMPNTEQIIGRTLQTAVKSGQTFMPNVFFPDQMGPGLAERLKPGFRAVSIPIENIASVQGFARSGSIVDVLFRASLDDESPEMTVTLLEAVEVLALNQAVVPGQIAKKDDQSRDKGSVTLAVTPEQAKSLKVAEGRGELSLTLRHPDEAGDLQPVSTASRSMTLEEVLGVPRRSGPTQIEVYRAGHKEVINLDDGSIRTVSPLNRLVNAPIVNNAKQPKDLPVDPQATSVSAAGNPASSVGAND